MYTIILTNGKEININADEVEWHAQERMVKFINKCRTIAKINMDNVVGLIETDYIIIPTSEDISKGFEEFTKTIFKQGQMEI